MIIFLCKMSIYNLVLTKNQDKEIMFILVRNPLRLFISQVTKFRNNIWEIVIKNWQINQYWSIFFASAVFPLQGLPDVFIRVESPSRCSVRILRRAIVLQCPAALKGYWTPSMGFVTYSKWAVSDLKGFKKP